MSQTEFGSTIEQVSPGGRGRRWPACLGVLGLALVMRCPFFLDPGFAIDQGQFVQWSEKGSSSGLTSVYAPGRDGKGPRLCNYPPAYLYVLRGLAEVYDRLAPEGVRLDEAVWRGVFFREDSASTRLAVWLYKVPAIAADALLGVLLVLWLGGRVNRRWAAAVGAIYVCVPAVIHNSAIWGQMDAIPTLLVVASLEMARRRRVRWMSVLALVAVLTKAQAGVMMPVWVVVALQWAGRDWRRWLSLAGTVLVTLLVVLLPFRGAGGGIWDAYRGAAGYYPFTHLNGFSAWFLGNPLVTPHLEDNLSAWYLKDNVPTLVGMAPRVWGLAAFLGVWIYSMVVLWRRRADDRSLFWTARLLTLAFFVLSTQMHERYLFPAIGLWAWSFVGSRRWWACWILLGLCASINVLWVWAGPVEESAWAVWWGQALHRSWLGLVPGIWCSLAMIWVLASVLLGWLDGVGLLPGGRSTSGPGHPTPEGSK